MNNIYEIILGKRYKKCKENQIRNPSTRRCIDKNKKKAKEISNILKIKELPKYRTKYIYKKIIKKDTKEKKIELLKDLIIKLKKELIKEKEEKNKLELIKNEIKINLSPIKEESESNSLSLILKRKSANIENRIKYYEKIRNLLEINENNKMYCLRLFKKNINGNPIFRVGNKIILKNQIGTENINGVIYLSNIRNNSKYEYASKLVLNNEKTKNELKIFSKVNEAVLKKRSPHFPILYADLECNKFSDMNSSENKILISPIEQDITLFPKIIKMNKNSSFKLILTELADNDLSFFIKSDKITNELYLNTLTQIYLSIMFFYKETKCFHNDAYIDNFLYHTIKKGGYFHYEIFNENYYLENLGYLWVIWNYESSIEFNKSIEKNIRLIADFGRIINVFLPSIYKGLIKKEKNNISEETFNKILNIYGKIQYYNNIYTSNGMKILIQKILKEFVNNGLLKTHINDKSKIINSTPYKININNI